MAEVVGWGMYAPSRVVTNDELARQMDTSDEWIRTRTGISRRHIAGKNETTAQMAAAAARAALQTADEDPHRIELIIVATTTPDYLLALLPARCKTRSGRSTPAPMI